MTAFIDTLTTIGVFVAGLAARLGIVLVIALILLAPVLLALGAGRVLGAMRMWMQGYRSAGSLRFRTIQQFKGLEADVVILLVHNRPEDAGDHHRSPELLYVGCTRARHLLYVVNVG